MSGHDVHLTQRTYFDISGGRVGLEGLLRQWVRPLHDLLIACLGRPVTITDLRAAVRNFDGREPLLSVAVETMQPPAAEVSAAKVRNYDAPTLLLPDDEDVPFSDLIGAWLSLRSDIPEVIDLLCAPFHAPFMYEEHRYGNIFQAAESLAGKCFGGPERSPAEHKARVAAVTQAAEEAGVAAETVAWARAVLTARNDRTLRALLTDLLQDAGTVGEYALAADANLPGKMAKARAGVSHGGAAGTPTAMRYWLGQILLWVVRMHVVREVGVDNDRIQRRVLQKPSFRHVVQQATA